MKKVLLVAVALLWANTAHADVAHVQTIRAGEINSDDSITSGSISVTAGSLLIAGIIPYGNQAVATVRLNGSTDFTFIRSEDHTSDSFRRAEVWYLENVSGGSHTVTVTFAGAVTWKTLFVTEVSGVLTTGSLDGSGASAEGVGTTPASGDYAATGTSFFYGITQSTNTTTLTAGSGWTIPTNGSDLNDFVGGGVEYKANPGSATQNASFTAHNTEWVAIGVAFKADGGGGGEPPPANAPVRFRRIP